MNGPMRRVSLGLFIAFLLLALLARVSHEERA